MATSSSRLVALLFVPTFLQGAVGAWYLGSSATFEGSSDLERPLPVPLKPTYARAREVRDKCPALSTRTDKLVLGRWGQFARYRMSFANGDWEQSPDVPIFPADNSSIQKRPVRNVVSLWIQDMSFAEDSEFKDEPQLTTVRNVSGVLRLAISEMYIPEAYFDRELSASSDLTIQLEGIFTQAENEDVLCMLGCSILPPRNYDYPGTYGPIPSTDKKNVGGNCEFLVQFTYPVTFNLTSRIIRGQINSLAVPGTKNYFSPINVSSMVQGGHQTYNFTAKDLQDQICGVSDFKNFSAGKAFFHHDESCILASYLLERKRLEIDVNWNCSHSEAYCNKLGPFSRAAHDTVSLVDYTNSNLQIAVQDLECLEAILPKEGSKVTLRAVFRLSPSEDSARSSALNGHTIVAEGAWKSLAENLCMVACTTDSTGIKGCDMKICLHISLSISIRSHSVLEGSISSIWPPDNPRSFYPLSFSSVLKPNRRLPKSLRNAQRYNYTRIPEAGAVLEKWEPNYSFKLPVIKYPSLIGDQAHHHRILGRDLSLHTPLRLNHQNMTYFVFNVLAVEDYLTTWSSADSVQVKYLNVTRGTFPEEAEEEDVHVDTSSVLSSKKQYLTIGAKVSIFGAGHDSHLEIYTEGYYNPKNGRMYMVGCRKVKAPWKTIHENFWSLSDGLDCEIELALEYPSTLATWLLNPSVKIVITSIRPSDSAFYFPELILETIPVLYSMQRAELVSRKTLEGALTVFTLTALLVCIFAQLNYIAGHPEAAAFISLLMLSVQAMGFVVPLVTGVEAFFSKHDPRSSFRPDGEWTESVMYIVKILTLAAFLMTMRLFEKVWKARARTFARQQSDLLGVPQERHVFGICLFIYTLGFLLVMIFHSPSNKNMQDAFANVPPLAETNWKLDLRGWRTELLEYGGLVEDLFLLPQLIGGSLWQVKGKPLRKAYYIGATLLRLLPHIYVSLQRPDIELLLDTYADLSFDFYSRVSNIVIPVLALLLVLLVYIQQRWNGILHFPSRIVYERLPSKISETELAASYTPRSTLPPIPEDDDNSLTGQGNQAEQRMK